MTNDAKKTIKAGQIDPTRERPQTPEQKAATKKLYASLLGSWGE